MANWDQLTVRCDDEVFVDDLVNGKIEGLWFGEAKINPDNYRECFCEVKNGIAWPEILERETRDTNRIIYCQVAFEASWWFEKYHLKFENGRSSIIRFDAGYFLDIDESMPVDFYDGIKTKAIQWAREVDFMNEQERKMVERQGEHDITYSTIENKVPFYYQDNGKEYAFVIGKNGHHVFVDVQ